MATFYFKEPALPQFDIESTFGIKITEVRGLNPPQPKEIFTRDWAAENGVDYYFQISPNTRKVKSSELTIQFYAVDDLVKTALYKYDEICNWLITRGTTILYSDTLQYRSADVIYTGNKPAWYQLFESTPKKLVAEITLLNPTGVITNVEPTP